MFKRSLFLATIALSSAAAFAGAQSGQSGCQTFSITPGQGQTIAVTVPTVPPQSQAPYALTGQSDLSSPPQLTQMSFGQGSVIWVAR